MKRLLIVLMLVISVAGCSNPSDHNVGFGMTMDEVKKVETRGRILWEDSASINYTDIKFGGLPASLLYYFPEGLLTLFQYSFDLEYADEDSYEHLKSSLIGTYGKPSDERQNHEFIILSTTWALPDVTVTLTLSTNPMTEEPMSMLYVSYSPTIEQQTESRADSIPNLSPESKPMLTAPDEPDWNMYISNTETGKKMQLFSRALIDNLGEGEKGFIPLRPDPVTGILEQTITYTYGATIFDEDFGLVVTSDNGWINRISNKIRVGLCLEGNWTFNDSLSIGTYIHEIIDIFGESEAHPQNIDTKWEVISYYLDENGMPTSIENAKVWLDVKFNAQENFVREYEIGILSARGGRNAIIPYLINEEYVSIDYMHCDSPNSANGVDLSVAFRNNSLETIKYIYFTVTPYNAVGDVASCEVSGKSTVEVEVTGPLASDKRTVFTSENLWYNSNIKSALLESVRIIYMDGEEVTLAVER